MIALLCFPGHEMSQHDRTEFPSQPSHVFGWPWILLLKSSEQCLVMFTQNTFSLTKKPRFIVHFKLGTASPYGPRQTLPEILREAPKILFTKVESKDLETPS